MTIDAQVHANERKTLAGPPEIAGDDIIAVMDTVEVDGAALVLPFTMYRYGTSYVLGVRAAHPDRFALVKPVNAADPAMAQTIADWAATRGTIGIRLILLPNVPADPAAPADAWDDLPKLLALAEHANVAGTDHRSLHAVAQAVSYQDIWSRSRLTGNARVSMAREICSQTKAETIPVRLEMV